jgi:hypothetical protein
LKRQKRRTQSVVVSFDPDYFDNQEEIGNVQTTKELKLTEKNAIISYSNRGKAWTELTEQTLAE